MRKHIFHIIKKQKEEEERKDKRIPLYKRDSFNIDPPKEYNEPKESPTNISEEHVDYNVDDQKNIINNTFRL